MGEAPQCTFSTANSSNRNNINEDFSVNVFSVNSYPPSRADFKGCDADKVRATLLCSGVFLVLVGTTFTIMGWINYDGSKIFEWTQLLGPALLCIGVTFILIGLCKIKNFHCKFWKVNEEQAVADQIPPTQSFVFTGINQPIMFHGTTVVQYIPPPCGIVTNDRITTNNNQSSGFELHRVPTTSQPPQYYTIYPLDNPIFSEDDPCTQSLRVDDSDIRDCGPDERPDWKMTADEMPNCSAPPAYEDIFHTGRYSFSRS
ncbi:transmembrane protein 174 [Paramormyrops kingsleyae]|uniref:Transmembrane protein 174 n=1 Tax=Paramormyrops kingsleyae TaxID=1676925 RepID=A0A3B3Q6K3_9TELE|nr:transmembrane protein 174 [Paramormyrops kingsleyae]